LISFDDDDENLTNYINALENMPDLNEKLVMLFYIKCRLVSLQYKSIIFISSSVTNVIHLIDNNNNKNDVLKTNFLNIFIDCMLRNRNKAYSDLQTSSSQKLINIAFNWLIEFMETTTRNSAHYFSSNKKIEFILDIFTCFVYAWSNQWLINNESDAIIDYGLELKQQMISKLDIYLKKLSKLTYWKQIQSKLIDWLILVSNFKSIINDIDTYSIIKSALIELFLIQDNNLNSDTWFKYAEFMSK